jgi:hypothetical protein
MVCVSISVLTAAETALRLERGESYQSSSIRARLTPSSGCKNSATV